MSGEQQQQQQQQQGGKPNFLASMKRASQRLVSNVADAGAKTMLKTDMVFLERDMKARKHEFGLQVYDILQGNSGATPTGTATISAAEVQKAFEACRADITGLQRKVDAKRREMENIERSGAGGGGGGTQLPAMDDTETPGIPDTP